MSDLLHVEIRTPHGIVAKVDAVSIRVPTPTGKVGLRPRGEAIVLALEPGLILMRTVAKTQYAGTAGGLLIRSSSRATILTAIAIVADDRQTLIAQLEAALAIPSEEIELRGMLGKLEAGVLRELQRTRTGERPAVPVT